MFYGCARVSAFAVLAHRNQDLEHRLRLHFGEHITQVHLKMADTPAGTLLPAALRLWPCMLIGKPVQGVTLAPGAASLACGPGLGRGLAVRPTVRQVARAKPARRGGDGHRLCAGGRPPLALPRHPLPERVRPPGRPAPAAAKVEGGAPALLRRAPPCM